MKDENKNKKNIEEGNLKEVKSKKMSPLLIICIGLSAVLMNFSILELFMPCDGLGCISKALIIVYLPIFLLYIWGIYFCIVITKYLYKKKKSLALMFVVFILLLVHINTILNVFNLEKHDLSSVFPTIYSEKKDFLIHNNTLYYYEYDSNTSDNPVVMLIESVFNIDRTTRTLNSMNLEGNDYKILCTELDETFIDGEFRFIKNNELYYDNGPIHKKINLSSCKITDVMDGYHFIKNPSDDAIAYMYRGISADEDGGSSIIKYDLDNNKIIQERRSASFHLTGTIIDYQNFDIYYVDNEFENDVTKVYVNDSVIYTKNGVDLKVLMLKDNNLLLYDKDKIYVIDLNTNKIVKDIVNNFDSINRIYSDTNDNYFLADGRIYSYNQESNNIEDVFNKSTDIYYKAVYHYGNKLVFDSGYCSILIYDKNSKEIIEYEDVLYRYDNGVLHIISRDEDNNKVIIESIK